MSHTYRTDTAIFVCNPDLSGDITIVEPNGIGSVVIAGQDLRIFLEEIVEVEMETEEEIYDYVIHHVSKDLRTEYRSLSIGYFMRVAPFQSKWQGKLLEEAFQQGLTPIEFYELVELFKRGPENKDDANQRTM